VIFQAKAAGSLHGVDDSLLMAGFGEFREHLGKIVEVGVAVSDEEHVQRVFFVSAGLLGDKGKSTEKDKGENEPRVPVMTH
jgi:hypothetical protein